jgi:hypothetical protein
MANWLDKYEQGGLVLKKKTKDNYGKKANPNDVQASVGPDFVGLGYNIKGRDYSPAWGGRFQNGGFLQPNSSKLPEGYVIPYNTPSTELAMSIGGEKGEPAYLIPSFKGGKKLKDPIAEYKKTGEHLGGPFKTWQEAEKFGEMRHEYVEKGQSLPSPLRWWDDMQMGGSMPGTVGFTYARTAGSAPANGKYTKKTKASAQNGKKVDKPSPNEKKYQAPDKKEIVNWFKNYYASPLFKENLYNKGLPDEGTKVGKETTDVINKLNFTYNDLDSLGNPDNTAYDNDKTINITSPNKYWNQSKSAVLAHELAHVNQDEILSHQPRHLLYMLNRNKNMDRKSAANRLFSLANQKPANPAIPTASYRLSELKDWAQVENRQGSPWMHDDRIGEIRSDVMALRYLAAKEGIWDAVTNKPGSFTPEMLDKLYKIKDLNTPMVTYDQYGSTRSIPNPESLKPNDLKNVAPPKKPGMILERLRKRYRDSELLDLMNWLAKNEDTTPMDQAQNGKEMKFYQEGLDFKPKSISQDGKTIPNEKDEIKPITTSQRNIGQAAAWKVIEAIKANTPYQLSESAVKSGIDQSLTCIGGVCNVYKDLGVDFSGVGNEKQGVRESRTKGKVVEYNPTFDKNYKAAGFEKVKGRPIEFNELTDIIQKGNLNPGDFIQYYNEKGIPDHTNIVLGSNPDGSVEVYNSYKHGQATRGESKEPYVYTLNPSAQGFKGKKINVFRVGDQKATEIRDASANDPSGITNTWFNYNMEKGIQRRMKILEKDYQELAKQSGEPAKKLTPSQLRKAAIEEERRIYESDPMFKRNLEIINTVDFSESPQEAMYRTLNKKKNGGWLDNYSEPIRDDRGQWAHPGEVTEIGSNDITMQGVDYPVLGVSDTGDTQMMYPDQDYKFDGSMVTEYPMAQDGENITKRLKKEAEEKLERMKKPKATLSQYTPKKGEQAKFDKQKLERIAEESAPLNRMAASKGAKNMQDAIEAALIMEGGLAAGKLVGKGAKAAAKYATEQTALKNAYKLNPYAFKPTEGMMYRGLGKEGMEDALASGVFRAKQNVEPYMVGNFNLSKKFTSTYYTPYFNTADRYGQGYVAEVPRTASGWGKRYANSDWSQIAQRNIPITEGKILKKDWLKGYKEVPKPTSTSRRLTNEEIRGYNQKLYLDRKKGLGNQGPTDAPPEGLMPFESPEYKQGGWLNKYK